MNNTQNHRFEVLSPFQPKEISKMRSKTATTQTSFPMNGGDGSYSYANNSSFQRQVADVSKLMIAEVVAENLDIQALSSKTFRLADLGCSVGPNTFIAMQHVVETVERKYLEEGLRSELPEFQVFFNDHVGNDFNTLFASLPTEMRYFACGVPGSFHGRLFPESSIHFVYSSNAVHWLSKIPEEILDRNSPTFNKGKVDYVGAPIEVAHAYASQFFKDMAIFLNARAKELVVGGIMVLIMTVPPAGSSPYRLPSRPLNDILESCFMEMVKTGIIDEAQADSFNHPVYRPSSEQLRELVERNGCFSIERIEIMKPPPKLDVAISVEAYTMHVRASIEGLMAEQFGSEIIDNFFDLFLKKAATISAQLKSDLKHEAHQFVVLKRK